MLSTWGTATGSNRRAVTFGTSVLPSGITDTCSNNGKATYFNSSGVLTTVSSNNFGRINYNGATLAVLGFMDEPAATNLCLQSNLQFGGASPWGSTFSVITLNAGTSPDGTSNASTVADTSANNTHNAFSSAIATTGSQTYTISAFFRNNTIQFASLGFTSAGVGSGFSISADLSAGTITHTDTYGTGSIVASSITSVGGGWYRLTATGVMSTSSVNGFATVATLNSGTANINTTYVGSGKSLYAYGVQVEATAFATSLIATTTATVTRAADVAVASVPDGTYNITINRVSGQTVLTNQSVSGGYTIPTNVSEVQSLIMWRTA